MEFKPLFTEKDIDRDLDEFQKQIENEIILKLSYIGEQFVNDARLNGTYKDRTGNLRSSIGYIIVKAGKILKSNYKGTSEGVQNAQETAVELLREFSDDILLIGFAGMEYGLAVESRGYDVIAGSTPQIQDILKELME